VQHLNAVFSLVRVDIYRDNGISAWNRIREFWPALSRSQLLRIQHVRILMYHLRARCALAVAENSVQTAPLLRAARKDVSRLEKERVGWADSAATLIRAGIASMQGDKDSTVELLRRAAENFDRFDMHLYAAAARRRVGELVAGEKGASMIGAADDWMEKQCIRNPVRMTRMIAPGIRA
jgi:hypothetical protein